MMNELQTPSWNALLSNAVTAATDYSLHNSLPGFLSESYTGNGVQYTGRVGIPELAVSDSGRITTSPSLYTLGVAYLINPDLIEHFLATNWPVISSQLLTSHGPWEGMDMTSGTPVKFQTSAHTLALALGLLGTGPDAMNRYLASHGLTAKLQDWYTPGPARNFLTPTNTVFAWSARGALHSERLASGFHVAGTDLGQVGIAFVPGDGNHADLSGCKLSLRYRSSTALSGVTLQFKPAGNPPPIMNQAKLELRATGVETRAIELILPATPGFGNIKEIVLSIESAGEAAPLDLTITGISTEPLER